ncbi:IS1380 family transposase, partial [Micromonospora sp. NPDC005806]
TFFSVGVAITEAIREAIRQARNWIPAVDTDGQVRDGAEICEITGLAGDDGYPAGTRFIVRRERPHPGAQLTLFDTIEGWRHQVMATDTPAGQGSIQHLEARHRAHARVEDRIRTGNRLLHVPARITRSARQTRLRIAVTWPWAEHLAAAFTRLAALPRPLT